WFEEDGLRVLYILPRAWTDEIIPLKLEPAPQELVRVMVGRAEIISRELEQQLSTKITKTQTGDHAAANEITSKLRKLGRFAEPAVQLATRQFDQDTRQVAWQLLNKASAAENRNL